MTSRHTLRLLTMCCIATTGAQLAMPSQASAQAPPSPEKITLHENFSPLEITTIGVSTAGALFLIVAGEHTFGSPAPSLGPPDERSLDWRFSHWANPNPDPTKQWLGGAPDTAGYVLPFAALGIYTMGTIGHAASPNFFMKDKSHELLAFTEAFAWTMVVTNGLKLMVGRARPFTVREDIDTEAVGEPEKEFFLSFPSGHSASAAATSTFLALDLSDHLVHHTFKESHPALRYGVGYGVPLLGAVGTSWVVMYSRIKDQRHWLSDTITGAMIGTGFSTLFYVMHFDETGEPRKRHHLDEEDVAEADEVIKESYMTPSASASGPMLTYGFIF
jgi:membrane-associated phospholipid phosphatase